MHLWYLLPMVLLGTFKDVDCGGGTMSILFVQYGNPDGEGDNGECCDGKWGICQSNGCDHKFTICVDTVDSDDGVTDCAFGNFQTSEIEDEDTIDFRDRDDLGGLDNPIVIEFSDVPENLVLKVDVWDNDHGLTGDDDHVDFLRRDIDRQTASGEELVVEGTHTTLTITVEVECDEGWSGEDCSQPESGAQDCYALLQMGHDQDGVYEITPADFDQTIRVYCDMSGGGWTVFQRRDEDQVNWDRDWEDYKQGFGEPGPHSEFWLGLENLHMLTLNRGRLPLRLRITMETTEGEEYYAEYDYFGVDDEDNLYRLHLEGYSGDAGDALTTTDYGSEYVAAEMPFTTRDNDNDGWDNGNCAQDWTSGWWHNECFTGNLNYNSYPYWRPLSGSGKPLATAAMMIRMAYN